MNESETLNEGIIDKLEKLDDFIMNRIPISAGQKKWLGWLEDNNIDRGEYWGQGQGVDKVQTDQQIKKAYAYGLKLAKKNGFKESYEMKMNESKTLNEGIADKLFRVRVGGNFWGGRYYEDGVDSIVVSAKSKEEAHDIAIANKKAVVAHFHEKRIGSGKGRKALKTSDNNVKITKTVTPFVGDSFWRTLTRDGKFASVKLTEEAKEQVMNEARLPAGKEKELRKKLKLINDFHWGSGEFKSPSSQKKKWSDFLDKNGWQGIETVKADELQKFVDYGEKLMTGSNKGRKPKELRIKLKVINDFLWKRNNKKWTDFLGKNGWQGIDTVKDSELQKFVDYGEELMTGKKMNEARTLNEGIVDKLEKLDDFLMNKASLRVGTDWTYWLEDNDINLDDLDEKGRKKAYAWGLKLAKKQGFKESYETKEQVMNESETFKEFSTELEQMLNSKLFEAIETKKRKIAGEMSAELSSKAK